MSTKNKILWVVGFLLAIFVSALILNITYGVRNLGISSAKTKALVTAEIVKEGLTAHMVNGIMDKRDYYLKQISNSKHIKSIWVARSRSVIEQFGEGYNNELARDNIDKEVLKTGKTVSKIIEKNGINELRVTIPYKATSYGELNCLQCHTAKENETLGVVSMIFDISEVKSSGIKIVVILAVISIVLMILLFFGLDILLKPYMKLFDSINYVMKKADEGDYSKRVKMGISKDGDEVAKRINTLLEKLQHTLDDIEKNIALFMTKKDEHDNDYDPLIKIQESVVNLSKIFVFKKIIELDESLEEVYSKIVQAFKYDLKLGSFNIVEFDNNLKESKYVYIEKDISCSASEKGCRAYRTNALVESATFKDICAEFKGESHYLCVPYKISKNIDLVITFIAEDEEDIKYNKSLLPYIEDYINVARSEIISKKLTEILKESSVTDQLTGFYNRKFLDEFIETAMPQAERSGTTYGVLMADIDYFKLINDKYGHDIGDEAIRVVSKVISNNIRNSDLAIRFGGEEFLILLYNCDSDFIEEVAEKIRIAFSLEKIQAGRESFTKTISIGTSFYPDDSPSIWKCIKFADIALYKAKESGRNKVVRFEESMADEELLSNDESLSVENR